VVILRSKRPELDRGFRVPAAPVVATIAVLMCHSRLGQRELVE
jgi:hypothetical protein